MKKLTGLFVGCCLLVGGFSAGTVVALAQEMKGPPPVLVIQREFLKPGRAGSLHEKSESAFVRAMTAAKWPTSYFAVESMSGISRALFLVGYPSLAAWEKDNMDMAKNATLSAAMDRASYADGDLLTQFEQSVYTFDPEKSLRADVDIAHMRYFEAFQFHIRVGHEQEWNELVKMYKEGYEKAVPDEKWAMFQSVYGTDNGGVYLLLNPMKSLAESDKAAADEKAFIASMGEDKMKRLGELSASCIVSQQLNLFRFNPKMSYPNPEWVKADPEFWKVKPAPAAAAKPAP